ncbi:MAG TPA: hypothetical protein VN923_03605 [Thermoanaerobaculia bacterium]|nr:hypothetical protein [Thermoanaerobaculia bacterium]
MRMPKPDLSKLHLSSAPSVPTMIVPPGTQIQVDPQGQVSIRTPGNLVLQNSGAYATLESVSGSIRIEPQVHVEAVTVRCADTCLVQGTLTAWRVVARILHVDNDAEARVVMQETDKLEVGKNGRVVGNFRSEKELFELFSRFAGNVRALPSPFASEAEPHGGDRHHDAVDVELEPPAAASTVAGNGKGDAVAAQPFSIGEDLDDEADEETAAASSTAKADKARATIPELPPADLPDALSLALLLLEQERATGASTPGARRSLGELVRLLREGDVDTLRHTYKTLFARLAAGAGEPARRARQAVGTYFDAEIEHPSG